MVVTDCRTEQILVLCLFESRQGLATLKSELKASIDKGVGFVLHGPSKSK